MTSPSHSWTKANGCRSILPQWSSRRQAAANYNFEDHHLALRIDAEQAPWCPEYDGDVRVSSLQTGLFAGPVGSTLGQHRFNWASVVREAQVNRITYAPTVHARIDVNDFWRLSM